MFVNNTKNVDQNLFIFPRYSYNIIIENLELIVQNTIKKYTNELYSYIFVLKKNNTTKNLDSFLF